MKLLVPFLSVLATSQAALAAPAPIENLAELPPDTGLEVGFLNPADEALAVLEKRAMRGCQVIDRTIRTIGTSKFT